MSKPVVVDVPHELGREEAKRRLQAGFGRIREQIAGVAVGFEERWEGDRLDFQAKVLTQRMTGRVHIFDKSVRIEVDLPWILAAIAERVQGRIRSEGTLLLEKK